MRVVKTKSFILYGMMALSLVGSAVTAQADSAPAVPALIQKLTKLYDPTKLPTAIDPQQQKDPLGHLVALQRKNWSQAWVSGTFYDYRTVSQWRRQAGLHLGYDIALPYGTSVSAGWGGVVTSIVPWSDTEWGVTVESPGGVNVTYGHIAPSVTVGQSVAVGQTVGRVALDHVDVKMRDSSGQYIPFGEGSNPNAAVAVGRPNVDRNTLLTAWLVARSNYSQAEDDLFYAENAGQKLALEKRAAERKVEALERTLEQIATADQEGLISRRRLEELKAEKRSAQSALDKIKNRKSSTTDQLRANVKTSKANLKSIESWASSQGLKWSDVEVLIKKTLASDKKLRETVQEQERTAAGSQLTVAELQNKVKEGKARLEELEDLYKSGGLSRAEIEDQRLKQQLLQEELRIRTQRK